MQNGDSVGIDATNRTRLGTIAIRPAVINASVSIRNLIQEILDRILDTSCVDLSRHHVASPLTFLLRSQLTVRTELLQEIIGPCIIYTQ